MPAVIRARSATISSGFSFRIPARLGAGFTKSAPAPTPAPEIPKFSEHYKLAWLTADLPCSVDHGIIGLMDPAHGPFVHQAWWWRTQKSIHEKHKNFEPIPYGFRMSAHTPSSNSAPYKLLRLYADADSITTTIDFVLPNLRSEIIRAGKYWFSSLTTVTPITRSHCRIDVVAAWNLFRWIPFGAQLLKFVFAKFVEQDRRTMELQTEGLKHNPHLMLIDDADRPAKWYFGLKSAMLEVKKKRRRIPASDERAGYVKVEKLEGSGMLQESAHAFSRFCEVADQFCAVVDSTPSVSRDALVLKIYQYYRCLSAKQ